MPEAVASDRRRPSTQKFSLKLNTRLGDLAAAEWNALRQHDNPFTRYEFLCALEQHDCLSRYGWLPCHLTLHDAQGALCAALPAYIKTNNYGEFVFDWSWEQAYSMNAIDYYPKLVSAVPYTPVSGERLLAKQPQHKDLLIDAAMQLVRRQGYSGMHWLFTERSDRLRLKQYPLAFRLDCQYHWHNNGYQDFDDFLSTLRSKKRKMIQRERRLVRAQNIAIQLLSGDEISSELWQQIHRLYCHTFAVKSGYPTLSQAFFEAIAQTMPECIVVVLAMLQDEIVACAINLRDSDTLYGRHWGAHSYHDCLHFESCYYAAIEYCIKHGLTHFAPGAQGAHKLARGFLPTATYSAHWLANPSFMRAAAQFCTHEQEAVAQYIHDCWSSLPYRSEAIPIAEPKIHAVVGRTTLGSA